MKCSSAPSSPSWNSARFFFQAEAGIRDVAVTGVQTCALPISTMRTVARHRQVQTLANGILARGAAVCGSPNIRNMATLAGNVASALPSADTPPALIALNAQTVLVGTQGERIVPLESFFVGPAKSVRERELIRELRIPLDAIDSLRGGFYKIGRTSEDISMVNAATTLIIKNSTISAAHLVLGAVAPIPLRVK